MKAMKIGPNGRGDITIPSQCSETTCKSLHLNLLDKIVPMCWIHGTAIPAMALECCFPSAGNALLLKYCSVHRNSTAASIRRKE